MEKAFHPILPIELGDGFTDDHRSKSKKFIHLSTKNLCPGLYYIVHCAALILYFNKTLYKSIELNIYVFSFFEGLWICISIIFVLTI